MLTHLGFLVVSRAPKCLLAGRGPPDILVLPLVAFVVDIASIALEVPMPHQEEMRTPVALSESDPRQVLELYQKIQRSRAKLVGPDGRTQSLPVSLYEFLVIAKLVER